MKKFEEINTLTNDLERLIILRFRLNFKKYQMARALDISSSYYCQVESGKYPISKSLKKRINRFLIKEQQINEENLFSQYK